VREVRAWTAAIKALLGVVLLVAWGTTVVPQEDALPPEPSDLPQSAQPPDRRSRLQGTAYLDRNEDVIGATVVVHEMEDRSTIYLTSTDENGRFRVEGLPDGHYKVRVHRHGVETIVKDNVSVRFPFRAVVELDMEQIERGPILPTGVAHDGDTPSGNATLHGMTRTPGGNPMGEVKLRIVKTEGRADPLMATTAEDGTFRIDGIEAGEWRVTIVGVGMLPIRTWVYLVGDHELDIKLVLQPAAYDPSPLELMPIEDPIPPAGMEEIIKKG
jgi:hypothetical protein